jgi:lipopolysaccharide export system permease protein
VLVLQFFWLYIDDLIGKGIDFFTISKLMYYVALTIVPLALPIAILLSSIMTFGNLGESFELVAIRSAGIPLLRFMRPLLVFSFFLSGIAFLFSNNIIPMANLRLNLMKYDFTNTKPTFDIKEGMFYDKIPGYTIKVGKKDENGTGIYDIIIYETGNAIQENLIIADSGQMKMSDDKSSMDFILTNGTRYEERGYRGTTNNDFIRLNFREYKKTFDLSSFTVLKSDSSAGNRPMMSVRQINIFIDSVKNLRQTIIKNIPATVMYNFTISRFIDSGWLKTAKPLKKPVKSMSDVFPDSLRTVIMESALSQVVNAKNAMDVSYANYTDRNKDLRGLNVEWHRKFTLSAACLVLFLIGAPLGSIIRKGGIGTPLVFAIIFFVLFHLMNTFGGKFAGEGVLSPFTGMWLSTMVLTPIGIFLTYKAMRDSQLFNQEYYFRVIKGIATWVRNRKKPKTTTLTSTES